METGNGSECAASSRQDYSVPRKNGISRQSADEGTPHRLWDALKQNDWRRHYLIFRCTLRRNLGILPACCSRTISGWVGVVIIAVLLLLCGCRFSQQEV
jgi:hypothetical protein